MSVEVRQVYEVVCLYCGVVERTANELWADAQARLHHLHHKTHHEQHTEGEGS